MRFREFKGPGQDGKRNGNWKGGIAGEPYRYVKKFKERNPDKVKAHRAVAYAVRSGKLVRMNCETCGSQKTHAHHDDYSKVLEVRWLCRPCHRAWHAANDRPMGHPSGESFPCAFPGDDSAPRAATLEAGRNP